MQCKFACVDYSPRWVTDRKGSYAVSSIRELLADIGPASAACLSNLGAFARRNSKRSDKAGFVQRSCLSSTEGKRDSVVKADASIGEPCEARDDASWRAPSRKLQVPSSPIGSAKPGRRFILVECGGTISPHKKGDAWRLCVSSRSIPTACAEPSVQLWYFWFLVLDKSIGE